MGRNTFVLRGIFPFNTRHPQRIYRDGEVDCFEQEQVKGFPIKTMAANSLSDESALPSNDFEGGGALLPKAHSPKHGFYALR